MKLPFLKIYDALRDSFWFLPALMVFVAAGAALGAVALDQAIGSGWLRDIGLVWSGSAEGARGVLTVIAGSVMTVASIVFSLTVTAIAQTSSHFGPRVLRNFTADRGNQVVLGTFVCTFVYCLLVLRTIRSADESIFVPFFAVNVGILLALASVGVLIYFIHHITLGMQAETLITDIGENFQRRLPEFFPAQAGHAEAATAQRPPPIGFDQAAVLRSEHHGYIQRVDHVRLMALAQEHDLVLRLDQAPGDFVACGTPLLQVLPGARADKKLRQKLRTCFSLGPHRTPYQDPVYSLQLLVEIAAHALSPGINEPFTAIICIDWLGASLRGIAKSDMPSAWRHARDGKLRLVAHAPTFEIFAATAFNLIRLYGADNPAVVIRLLDVIGSLAPYLHHEGDRLCLRGHAVAIGQDARRKVSQTDRERVEAHLRAALRALADKVCARP